MNIIVEAARQPIQATPHTTHKLKWLLQREFWEHKGGFFWAPLISGAVFLFFTLIGGGGAQMLLSRHGHQMVSVDGQKMPLSEINLSNLLSKASPDDLRQFGEGVTWISLMSAFWPMLVFGIVVFFYLLGSLYDERKDRSVLFWKSLPVSDGVTVLSKVLTALVVAPLIASVIALATMLAFGLIISLLIAINGANPFTVYWARLDPLLIAGALIGWIPIYALWALPTVGWLMLCSAWARSKPFLWAIMIPVFTGILVNWFDLLKFINVESSWFWKNIVARLLASAWPGSHFLGVVSESAMQRFQHANSSHDMLSAISGMTALSNPNVWIGAVAGLAMILAAARLRRWRDEG